MVAATAVSVAVLACASAPVQPPVLPAGYTDCGEVDGKAVSAEYIRVDVLFSLGGREVLAHEAVHGDDIERFDTCAEYAAWLAAPGVRAQAEARAFCAQARVNAEVHQLPEPDYPAFAEILASSQLYANLRPLAPDSAEQMIRDACAGEG